MIAQGITSRCGSVQHRSYDAFGAQRNALWGNPSPSNIHTSMPGFTGHEDDELGLVNMKGRIYDPKVGRFLTPDPFAARPGSGQSWNPYSYVLNNPLTYVDPSGFGPESADSGAMPGAPAPACRIISHSRRRFAWLEATHDDDEEPGGPDRGNAEGRA